METGYTERTVVTPKSLKIIKNAGLLESDKGQYTENLMAIYTDDADRLKEVCSALFEDDFSKVDVDDIDLQKVTVALSSFFLRVLGVSKNSQG